MPDGQCLPLHVVEMSEGLVVDYYPLSGETAQTEWLQGQITLKHQEDDCVIAYYKEKPLT